MGNDMTGTFSFTFPFFKISKCFGDSGTLFRSAASGCHCVLSALTPLCLRLPLSTLQVSDMGLSPED